MKNQNKVKIRAQIETLLIAIVIIGSLFWGIKTIQNTKKETKAIEKKMDNRFKAYDNEMQMVLLLANLKANGHKGCFDYYPSEIKAFYNNHKGKITPFGKDLINGKYLCNEFKHRLKDTIK